jgi:hypothetical protein
MQTRCPSSSLLVLIVISILIESPDANFAIFASTDDPIFCPIDIKNRSIVMSLERT